MARRQIVTALLIAQVAGAIIITIGQMLKDPREPAFGIGVAATLLAIGILAAYRRGWEAALAMNMVAVTVAVGLGTPEKFVREYSALVVLVPPAVAQVLAGPRWILGSALGLLVILSLRAGPEARFLSAYTNDLRTLGSFALVVTCMLLSRLVADTALREATANGARAEEALRRADAQADALRAQAEALREQNERQQRLLDLVARLEIPAVALAEGVLLAPIVGPIDEGRAEALVGRLVRHASEQRARLVVLDVAGASDVDADAARALGRAVEALRLIGCRVAISGISAATASALAEGQVAFNGAVTVRTPREALERERAL